MSTVEHMNLIDDVVHYCCTRRGDRSVVYCTKEIASTEDKLTCTPHMITCDKCLKGLPEPCKEVPRVNEVVESFSFYGLNDPRNKPITPFDHLPLPVHHKELKIILPPKEQEKIKEVREIIEEYSTSLERAMFNTPMGYTITKVEPLDIDALIQTSQQMKEQQKMVDDEFRKALKDYISKLSNGAQLVFLMKMDISEFTLYRMLSVETSIPGWFYDRVRAYFDQIRG